jgi:hypothetical protein
MKAHYATIPGFLAAVLLISITGCAIASLYSFLKWL